MADSVDRVFAHALSTVRKIPRTGSMRPPSSDRLRLYGLYKQSMEGDVAHIMSRPLPSSLLPPHPDPTADPNTDTLPDPSTDPSTDPPSPPSIDPSPAELAAALARATPEERSELEKWDAWKACEGLSRTEAKRRYIGCLIRTMHVYASGTAEARALVEELEFVWEQVRGNWSGGSGRGSGSGSGSGRRGEGRGSGRDSGRDSGSGGGERDERGVGRNSGSGDGLRRLRPMSDVDGEMEEEEGGIDAVVEGSGGSPEVSRERNPERWRARVERALVQMTAEVAALRELVDATNSQRRLWARSGKKGWVIWAWMALWKLIKRAAVDAAVVAAVLLVLRWRYRERVEEWWEWLGDFMGFVRKNVRQQMKKRDVASLLGR